VERTTFRIGLPFSPFYWHEREERTSSELLTAPASNEPVIVRSGEMAITSGSAQITRTSFSYNWHIEFLSWSIALIGVGVVLLVGACFLRDRQKPSPPGSQASD
jgi:hypothetical protein